MAPHRVRRLAHSLKRDIVRAARYRQRDSPMSMTLPSTTLTRGQYAPLLYRFSAAPHSTVPQRSHHVFLQRDLRLRTDYFANHPFNFAVPNIDKKLIASRFGSRVNSYDVATPIQQRMAQALIERVRKHFLAGEPKRILELGCGTGRLTRKIIEIFPNAKITAVDISSQMVDAVRANCPNVDVILADAEDYICDLSEPFELIISNATVQWFENIEETLGHAYRLLANECLLAIATFGEHTFLELRESFDMAYAVTGREKVDHVVDIYPIHKLCTSFPKAEIVQEDIEQYFGDVRAFLDLFRIPAQLTLLTTNAR
ncbi:methyltransferase domain-containing protein [Candidatus Nitrotoga arctica]|uniref:methyltransferase domain-containing protein n=1 Tax=Candidatus Nitrotoga arctica TaxID=453162 RepID=UPI001EFC0495|nr:methyltransferase domain-containing protein [Candidatus Nitrotoga arctica]